MDEAKLLEKLRLIEALFAGATTAGEPVAAAEAKRRIQNGTPSSVGVAWGLGMVASTGVRADSGLGCLSTRIVHG
jgi:hypothetical protein